jgi:hypothetical protein
MDYKGLSVIIRNEYQFNKIKEYTLLYCEASFLSV